MTNHIVDSSRKNAARIAGLMFLLTLMGPLFYGAFLFPKLTVAGNGIATAKNIIDNELLFRIGIINEIMCSVVAVILALSLYIILNSVNKSYVLLAVFLKLTEATLLAVNALGHFMALLILKGQNSSTLVEPGHIQAFIGLFISLYFSLGVFPMVFLGLSMMIFLYVLFKSKYIPEKLSGFGIASYALIFIYPVMTILSPDAAAMPVTQIILFTPSILAELAIGSWLLMKGINVRQEG